VRRDRRRLLPFQRFDAFLYISGLCFIIGIMFAYSLSSSSTRIKYFKLKLFIETKYETKYFKLKLFIETKYETKYEIKYFRWSMRKCFLKFHVPKNLWDFGRAKIVSEVRHVLS